MMNFWKSLLASLLGSFIAFGLVMLLLIVLMIAAIGGALSSAGAGGGPVAEVEENSVLHVVVDAFPRLLISYCGRWGDPCLRGGSTGSVRWNLGLAQQCRHVQCHCVSSHRSHQGNHNVRVN